MLTAFYAKSDLLEKMLLKEDEFIIMKLVTMEFSISVESNTEATIRISSAINSWEPISLRII